MVSTTVEPVHRPNRSERHGQPELCVPPMSLKGDSYRLKDRDLGRVPTAANDDR
jgi:hypothetical protein